jgi:type IV pilus assembly protein PilZ
VQEKRVHPRVTVEMPVVCETQSGESIAGVARDISLGGIFVESSNSPPFGTSVTVVGALPGLSGEAKLPGIVRWGKPGGFGVQFGLLGARETHAITKLLRSHS